jgi:hypothetical protein
MDTNDESHMKGEPKEVEDFVGRVDGEVDGSVLGSEGHQRGFARDSARKLT